MAIGIDDALAAAAAGISLTDTCVQTIKAYRRKNKDIDIERLIEEVRVTALARIDEADQALAQLERTLEEQGVDSGKTLTEVIEATPFWQPFQAHRIKRIRTAFNALADATYSAADDIASLVRCRDQTREMGQAVAASAVTKHALHERLLKARSVREAIAVLRKELANHKAALNR